MKKCIFIVAILGLSLTTDAMQKKYSMQQKQLLEQEAINLNIVAPKHHGKINYRALQRNLAKKKDDIVTSHNTNDTSTSSDQENCEIWQSIKELDYEALNERPKMMEHVRSILKKKSGSYLSDKELPVIFAAYMTLEEKTDERSALLTWMLSSNNNNNMDLGLRVLALELKDGKLTVDCDEGVVGGAIDLIGNNMPPHLKGYLITQGFEIE